jgi:hypothetical protein
MIRRSMVALILGGVFAAAALFALFFFRGTPELDSTQRAQEAAREVGQVVVDQGVAGLVKARLVQKFGLEPTGFVHVHHQEGRVLIYGLLPESITQDSILSEALAVPGVKSAEVLTQPRPEHVVTIFSRPAAP